MAKARMDLSAFVGKLLEGQDGDVLREGHVLGADVGPSEDKAFWTTFLRSLVKRGLKGVCVW